MFQNKNLSAVKKNALFKGVSNTNLNFNFNPKDFIEIGEGEIIYQSGDPSDFLYLIIEGEVKLKISRGVASPFILRKVYNDFFGEREVQENSVRKSSAIANKDTLIYIIRKIDLSSDLWPVLLYLEKYIMIFSGKGKFKKIPLENRQLSQIKILLSILFGKSI